MKILIAEDALVSRRLLERHLQIWGHEVAAATNGAEAWQLFKISSASKVVGPLAALRQ